MPWRAIRRWAAALSLGTLTAASTHAIVLLAALVALGVLATVVGPAVLSGKPERRDAALKVLKVILRRDG